jgi:hypothetical protein
MKSGRLSRVLDEEDRCVVARHVVVAVLGVQLDVESTRGAHRISGAAPPAMVEKRRNVSVSLPTSLRKRARVHSVTSAETTKVP